MLLTQLRLATKYILAYNVQKYLHAFVVKSAEIIKLWIARTGASYGYLLFCINVKGKQIVKSKDKRNIGTLIVNVGGPPGTRQNYRFILK